MIASCCFLLASLLVQLLLLLIQNRFFVHGFAQARLTRVGNAVCIKITTPVHLRIHGGQYVNIWMPGMSIQSIFQSHPFVVASADREKKGSKLKLMIQPRRGWTLHLFRLALDMDRSAPLFTVLFSGPHGIPIPVGDYGIVILAASGSGILAQLPYLQRLIRGYNNLSSRTRRIRLVWELEHVGALLPEYRYSTLTHGNS